MLDFSMLIVTEPNAGLATRDWKRNTVYDLCYNLDRNECLKHECTSANLHLCYINASP